MPPLLEPEVFHYRLLLCKHCGWRWWSSSGENSPRIPECCQQPDVWEVRSFKATDMGPGLHPKQESPPTESGHIRAEVERIIGNELPGTIWDELDGFFDSLEQKSPPT